MELLSPWTFAVAAAGYVAAHEIGKWRIGHFETTQRSHATQIEKLDVDRAAHETRLYMLERAVREAEERSAKQTTQLLEELRLLRNQIHQLFMVAWKATPPES